MFVTVEFPPSADYTGNTQWFLDPIDRWTVEQLCDDITYAARVAGSHKLQRDGVDFLPSESALSVLSDGEVVTLVEV